MSKANILLVLSATLPAISAALQSLYVPPVTPQLYTRGPVNSWKMMPDEPMPEVPFPCLRFVVFVERCLKIDSSLTSLLYFSFVVALLSKYF
jgi:hypothetical protein